MSLRAKVLLNYSWKLVAGFAVLVAFGQNCSPGMSQLEHFSSSSILSSNSPEGQKLYASKCASCHGPIETSLKRGRTAAQIGSALGNVPQMSAISLSNTEIRDISIALNFTPPTGNIYKCVDPSIRGITADRMRKLSLAQLKNTLRDLLGTTIVNDSEFKLSLTSIPDDSLKVSVGEFNDNPALYHAKAIYDASVRAVAMMNSNSQLRSNILGSCTVSSLDENCIRTVISQFGRRVLRRPPTATETSSFVAFYNSMGAGVEGLNYLFQRLLQSPTIVFHIEDGNSPSNGRYRLSDYEIASRISYMTTDTMPDVELLDAASRGELQTLTNVKSQVSRLLAKPEAAAKVQNFIRYYTHLKELVPNSKAAASVGVSTSGLATEMKQEFNEYVNYIVFGSSGTYADLMTSHASFPRTQNLAKVLETNVISVAQPVSIAPLHAGLLHRPAILASGSDRTSPILRGALVRKAVLCDVLGDPPANAVAAREDEVGDLSTYSNRIGTDRLTSPGLCLSCHTSLNPLGYAFEKYNQLGARRTVEPLFDAQGNLVRTFPIDTTVTDPRIEDGGPGSLSDSTELVAAIAESRKAKACYSQKMFEYYNVRAIDSAKDGCSLAETEQKTGSQDLRSVLIDSIANEDIFWRKQP